jgi:protein SCO1/2
MRESTLPYWLTFVVVLGASYGLFTLYRSRDLPSRPSPTAIGLTPQEQAGETELTSFTLTRSDGGEFESDDLAGQVWVANFFYASCPSVCVRLSQQLAALQQEPLFDDVTFVSITTDPTNDTLEVLNQYAERFEADPQRWIFCRGPADYIKQIGQEILLVAADGPQHSERAVVIDRNGKVRGRFLMTDISAPNQVTQLRLTVADCLKEEAAPKSAKEDPLTSQPADVAAAEDAALHAVGAPPEPREGGAL